MHESFEPSVHGSYRLLDRDWIDGREFYTEPNPSRLRTACLMIYAGLLLSVGTVLASSTAAAQASDYVVAQNWGVVDGLEQCRFATKGVGFRRFLPDPGGGLWELTPGQIVRLDGVCIDKASSTSD